MRAQESHTYTHVQIQALILTATCGQTSLDSVLTTGQLEPLYPASYLRPSPESAFTVASGSARTSVEPMELHPIARSFTVTPAVCSSPRASLYVLPSVGGSLLSKQVIASSAATASRLSEAAECQRRLVHARGGMCPATDGY
ncbi:hypothetical protein NP493_632g01013 [Ridgeia piscesae]|uniref:Uncharacterized protein n=1 Tax=Ridgeia piscesae TaxID=27915 RepID=A0AAD9KT95_RIDPI|nr:hypothetical protein NP493_632g01013 [Ridgeia piscesae]